MGTTAPLWPSDEQLDDLVRRFHDCTLPKTEWTHAAHLAVGAWHVARFGPAVALSRLRANIYRLNESHGTANDDHGGYHETITQGYVTLLGASGGDGSASAVRTLLAGPLGTRDVLLRFYSRERLMSVAARRGWVEPDLVPRLPVVPLT